VYPYSHGIAMLISPSCYPLSTTFRLGIQVTPCICKKFADQSIDYRIGASVRDEDVFVLQTGNSPYLDPNDCLMELLIIISACKTASARRITAVIPSFPYSRHDKKDKSRAPITAKLVANMITVAGANHVITMDLHASQIQGFFDIPVDNLTSEPSVARWIRTRLPDYRNSIIVSPDAGGAKRATSLADLLGVDFALINRNRKREQNRRIRAFQRQQQGLSTQSSYSDLRSGVNTPMSSSFIVDHTDPTLMSSHDRLQKTSGNSANRSASNTLRSVNDELDALTLDEQQQIRSGSGSARFQHHHQHHHHHHPASNTGGIDTSFSGHRESSPSSVQSKGTLPNGVHIGDRGEYLMYDENGHRISTNGGKGSHEMTTSSNSSQQELTKEEMEDPEETKMEILVGDVKGKVAILVDDMVDTGKTLALAAKTLKEAGAKEVYAHISHGLLSGKATELLRVLSLERLIITNTIPNLEKLRESNGKLEIMDISAVVAESIRRTHNGESISLLFQEDAAVLL
jgi:ribose-phosphate pyrophosphokinase